MLISSAASFCYYTIFDHMTNICWNIKQNNKKKFLSCSNVLVTIMGLLQKTISTNSTAEIWSSYLRSSGKKCILRNFAKFTGKGLCQSLFFHKVAGLRSSIKFLRTQFLQNSPGRLLLKNNYHALKRCFRSFYSSSFLLEKQENRLLSHSFLFL